VAERVRVRDITADEGNRLLRIVRRGSKSVVTWRRATYTRPHAVRHLLAAHDLSRDRLYGHIKPRKRRGEFLVFLRYPRTVYRLGPHRAALLHCGGTRHASHTEQASMIRRSIAWRNRHAHDRRLGKIVDRANVA